MAVTWRPFPLVLERLQSNIDHAYINRVRARVCEEEESVSCKLLTDSTPMPNSSLPALVAARCAQLQGEDAFNRYHIALLRAPVEENRDISSREVLVSLAEENGLDVDHFVSEFDEGEQEANVLAQYYEELANKHQFSGIPTAVFGSQAILEGAVPLQMYREAVRRLLSL